MNVLERIRIALIYRLGGWPMDKHGFLNISSITVVKDGWIWKEAPDLNHLITMLHCVQLPTAGEGQHIVQPQVRGNPHRHKKSHVLDALHAFTSEELAERFLEMPVIEVGCPWSPELVALVKPGPEIAATLTGAQPPEPINLCQACKASAAECNDCMDKECDGQNNTIKCDQYRKEEK